MTEPIEWWVWVLVWMALALGLIAMLALTAWWLFRKFMDLLDDASALADRAARLEFDPLELPRPAIAVLASARDIRDREEARKAHRLERSRVRFEKRMTRARRITATDPLLLDVPATWYDG